MRLKIILPAALAIASAVFITVLLKAGSQKEVCEKNCGCHQCAPPANDSGSGLPDENFHHLIGSTRK